MKPKVYSYIVQSSPEMALWLSSLYKHTYLYTQTYEYAKAEFNSVKNRPYILHQSPSNYLSLYKVNTKTGKVKELEKAVARVNR